MRFPALLLITSLALPIAREHSAAVQHLPPRSAGDSVIVSTEWLAGAFCTIPMS